MSQPISAQTICIASKKFLIRKILDDTIIVAIEKGLASSDDVFFTLNESGNAVLRHFDGHQTLGQIASELTSQYTSPSDTILSDLIEFCTEMVEREIFEVIG